MKTLVVGIFLVSLVLIQADHHHSCGSKLVECLEKGLESEDLRKQWMECANTEKDLSSDEEVVEWVCGNNDDAEHLEKVEKARDCVRKQYSPGQYDKARKECIEKEHEQ